VAVIEICLRAPLIWKAAAGTANSTTQIHSRWKMPTRLQGGSREENILANGVSQTRRIGSFHGFSEGKRELSAIAAVAARTGWFASKFGGSLPHCGRGRNAPT
jgi:hypothetical protein